VAEPPFSSTPPPHGIFPLSATYHHPTTSLPRPATPDLPQGRPALSSLLLHRHRLHHRRHPRPPLGYTVSGDLRDVEVIEEYKETPCSSPVHGAAKRKHQNRCTSASPTPNPRSPGLCLDVDRLRLEPNHLHRRPRGEPLTLLDMVRLPVPP
jgi:hypothetical protein